MLNKFKVGDLVTVKVTNFLTEGFVRAKVYLNEQTAFGRIAATYQDDGTSAWDYRVLFLGRDGDLLVQSWNSRYNLVHEYDLQLTTPPKPPEPYTTNVPGDFPKRREVQPHVQ